MARNFNGTSDNIRIDAAARTIAWYNDPFGRAFCGWLKAPAGQSNVFMYSEGNVSSNNPFWGLSLISGGTNLLRASGQNFPAGGLSSISVVADSTWHHVAIVLYPNPLGTNNWFGLYVDGVLEASQGGLGSTISGANTNEATLGALRRSGGTPGNFYKGLLAHWAVWNRALSGEEVRMLARGIRMPSDFSPAHYWPMTDGEVGFIADRGHGAKAHGLRIGTTVSADSPPVRERVTPATWLRRYGAIASSSVTITLTDSGKLTLAADPPTIPIFVPSAVMELAADPVTVYPVTVAINPLTVEADAPAMAGPQTPGSGKLNLRVDAPIQSGPIAPVTSGRLRLAVDAPKLWTSLNPVTGKLMLRADPPTVIPHKPPPGKLTVTGKPPATSPGAMRSGLFRLAADPPTVYPLVLTSSGRLIVKSDPSLTADAGYVLRQSGILRLRSDVPIVTPLTEPVTPPPPTAGESISLAATV